MYYLNEGKMMTGSTASQKRLIIEIVEALENGATLVSHIAQVTDSSVSVHTKTRWLGHLAHLGYLEEPGIRNGPVSWIVKDMEKLCGLKEKLRTQLKDYNQGAAQIQQRRSS